jgi:TonB-linked SusC/RagA family outer membrane protein
MKNQFEKRLFFAGINRLKLLIMTNLCVLLLLCSLVKPVEAVTLSSHIDELTYLSSGTSDSISDQQLTIRGTIKDAVTGDPLPGVTVVVKGTTIGTLSDVNGKFSLTVPDRNGVLSFSFIGFTTQEIPPVFGSDMNVLMSLEVTQITEVVVVGYGTQKKESVVGAITQVGSASLVKSGITNVTNAITGKLSGVLTIQQTGEPGADQAEIIVRGLSSWNSSAPLVLVDGVERDFKDLDPNEINSISVLKDASATAVFGARGANGVIIVTTKRGLLGKAKMDFSSSFGMDIATRIPDHISSYTTMSMLNVALKNQQQFTDLISNNVLEEYRNPSSPLNALQYPDVNWYKELTRPAAPTFNTNLNIQGGTNFVKYFCSLGYLWQSSFFDGYHAGYMDTRYRYDRFNYRANLDFSLTKTTLLSLNLGGEIGIKNQPSSTTWAGLYGTSPSRFPAYFPDWVLQEVPDLYYPDASGMRLAEAYFENRGNPYTTAYQGSFNKYTDSKLFTDLMLEQKLDNLLKGLSFRGKVSLSTYYQNRSLYASYTFPVYRLYFNRIGVDANKDGVVDQNPWVRSGESSEVYKLTPPTVSVGGMEAGFYTDLYYEMSLNYSNTFGKHRVTGLALFNRQQQDKATAFPYYNEGLVGRATYDYSNKYLFEVNIGYTGSERFAPGNRFGFFPSGAIGWVISEESFFRNSVPWMNKLKLRYSDGLVGSDYATSRWLYISNYFLDSRGNIWEEPGPNSSAQWEEARKRDIGIEIGVFKNLFTLSVDLFDEQRSKMLLTPKSVTFVVGNTFKDLNLGSIKKHGIELEAEFNKTTANNINYFVKGIVGFNENRIINKDDPPYAPEYSKQAGKPIGAKTNGSILTGTGYYTSINDIHNNPSPISVEQLFIGEMKFLDYNVDGAINSLDKFPIKGSAYPPITYSLSSGISYKGFDFNFLFTGNSGKYIDYNMAFEYEFNYSSWRVHSSQLDYWRPDNPNATHSTLHYTGDAPAILSWAGGNASNWGFDIALKEMYWRNADYLRLKEIYAGYNFKSDFLKDLIGISSLNVYATANNLLTFTKLIEGDPERKDFYLGFYPLMTSIKLGLKFGF